MQARGQLGKFGLSPLTRGTRISTHQDTLPARFIPADAGNSGRGIGETVREAVYPR